MTTPRVQSDESNAMGPISYLIVEFPGSEFPGSKMTGEGFPILLDLVDRGLIRILDLRFVRREMDGSMRALELQDQQYAQEPPPDAGRTKNVQLAH